MVTYPKMQRKPVLEALHASREQANRFMYLMLHAPQHRPQIFRPAFDPLTAFIYIFMYTKSLENVAKSREFLEICTETKHCFISVLFCPMHLFGEYFVIPHVIKEGSSTYPTPATCLSDCAVMLNCICKS